MALRSTARRFGFEVSWLIRLTRQETSPTGPYLTLRLHCRLVIRHSSGHAISLSCLTAGLSGKVMTLVACMFIWGSSRLSCIPNPTISVFFYNNREGPLPVFKAVPLYRPHYGKWRHMPPRDLQCRRGRHPEATLSRSVSRVGYLAIMTLSPALPPTSRHLVEVLYLVHMPGERAQLAKNLRRRCIRG